MMKNKHYKNAIVWEKNRQLVMAGVAKQCEKDFGVNSVLLEKIEEDVIEERGKHIVLPDYFLRIKLDDQRVRTWTCVVKSTLYDSFKDGILQLKASVVYTCKFHRKEYPNPYLIAATSKKFALIPFERFWHNQPEEKELRESVKKVYLIDTTQFEWTAFEKELDFWQKQR